MYEPGGKSLFEELSAIAAAIRRGESDPLYRILTAQFHSFGTTGTGNLIGTVATRTFADAAVQEAFFGVFFDLGWVQASDVVPQICWAPGSAAAGNVNWGLEYAVIQPNGIAATATLTAAVATPGVAGQFTLTELATISTASRPIRSVLLCRLFRDGVVDSYNGVVHLLHLGFRTQVNGTGAVYPEAKA